MSELNELYQEILLEHNSKPRNFKKLEDATQSAEGFNPLCGDQISLDLQIADDDTIADVGFQGVGCAISRASASMMTQIIKGKRKEEAQKIFDAFHQMMTDPDTDLDLETLGDLESLSGVVAFPTRIKCAILAWHTMRAALEGQQEAVSLE